MDKKKLIVAIAVTLASSSFIPSLSSAASTGNAKVDWLVKNSQVVGRDGGNLALNEKITRAEFTKMVIDSQGLKAEADKKQGTATKYNDVPASHWASGAIALATEKGYVKGDNFGNFNPNASITYNEILTILSRLNPNFKEAPITGHWTDQFIKFAKDNGYLKDMSLADGDLFYAAIRKNAFEIFYNYYHATLPSDKIAVLDRKESPASNSAISLSTTPDSLAKVPVVSKSDYPYYWYDGRYYDGRYYYDGKWYDYPYYWYDGKYYDYPYYYYDYRYRPYYHTVDFVVDGVSWDSVNLRYSDYINLDNYIPSKAGYTFSGWRDSSGNRYSGTEYITRDITLYGNLNPIKNLYKVDFIVDKTKGTTKDSLRVYDIPYGTDITKVTAPAITGINGYKFTGWSPEYKDTTVTKDLVFVAQFVKDSGTTPNPTKDKFTVKFEIDSNKSDTESTEVKDVAKGTDAKNLAPKPVGKGNFEFTGWSPALGSVDRNITYVAQFKDKTASTPNPTTEKFTVKFNIDQTKGSTNDKVEYKDVAKDTDVATLKAPSVTAKDGYKFKEWSPKVKGKVTSDMEFNAVFEEDKPIQPAGEIQFTVQKLPKDPNNSLDFYKFNPTYPGATDYQFLKDGKTKYGPYKIGGAGAVEFSSSWTTLTLQMMDSSGKVIKEQVYQVSELTKNLQETANDINIIAYDITNGQSPVKLPENGGAVVILIGHTYKVQTGNDAKLNLTIPNATLQKDARKIDDRTWEITPSGGGGSDTWTATSTSSKDGKTHSINLNVGKENN